MSIITATPSYATLVADAYRLSASKGMTIADTSISIAYLTSEVNPSEEQYLRIYYSADGQEWQPLPSSRSPALNQVSAKVKDQGIYALMSSLELPLKKGWNLIGYPLAVSTKITNAVAITNVAAISGEQELGLTALQVIYSYEDNQGENSWRVYGPGNEVTNTLDVLEYGQGYQIYASTAVTLFVTGKAETTIGSNSPGPLIFNTSQFLTPPAVFVAKLASGGSLPDNVTIRAYLEDPSVEDRQCSQSNVQADVEADRHTIQIMVHAAAADSQNCAAMGQEIRFVLELNGTSYEVVAPWDNRKIQSLTFADVDTK